MHVQLSVLALLVSTLAAVPVTAATVGDRLRRAAGDRVELRLDPTGRAVRWARFAADDLTPSGDTPAAKAAGLLSRYGTEFGVADPAHDLELVREWRDRLGHTHLAYRQLAGGLPVLGGELRVHLDAGGDVRTVQGRVAPFPHPVATSASLTPEAAERRAAAFAADGGVLASSERLVVVRSGLLRGASGGADRLCWEVALERDGVVEERLYLDADDGRLVERVPAVVDLDRAVDQYRLGNRVWSEGDGLPFVSGDVAADTEINTLIETAADVHALFSRLSGGSFESWDGQDGTMLAVWADEAMQSMCPNAQWTGSHTRFCAGMANDDVSAHEWTHAYTQSTHGLIYLWQSGALNEAYSDIFGETVDLLNGTGLDVPAEPRSDDACTIHSGAEPPLLTVLEPAGLVRPYDTGGAAFNPIPPWTVEAEVEVVDDGVEPAHDACQALAGFSAGRIALVEYGRCLFRSPVETAAAAGAVGVIVVSPTDRVTEMPGAGDRLTIPALVVGKTDGAALRAAAEAGTLRVRLSSVADGSLRWLIGEDTSLGAIRDMWTPRCFGDPGAVGDSRYWCDSQLDNGGVHVNSGVPNRAFALLVDGGSLGGVTVEPLGLTRTSHVYWRAMSTYQVPISDFADHADALARSCLDLVGLPLSDLASGEPGLEVLTAADCEQIEAAIAAVGLRDPVPCQFATLLAPGGPGLNRDLEVFATGFDGGLDGWELEDEGVFGEYRPRGWQWTAAPPAGADGGAAFAANPPDLGDCRAGSDDQSAVLRLTSPPIALPATGLAPLLVVRHYVATYPGRDGGNLKLSVDGGPFVLVPAAAFRFNAYNGVIDPADGGNPNPLAGEPAFTGFNEGFFEGSWGTSQVDLAALATPGSTVRLRFELGSDGCQGLDGWYLDGIRVLMASPVRQGDTRAGD